MPYKSEAQRKWAHTKAGVKALGGKSRVAEWDSSSKGRKRPSRVKAKKVKVVVNNKMKGDFGATSFDKKNKPVKVEINVKKHIKKGKIDKAELASTIKHELLHVKHPKMTEKEVYKRSAKTKLSPQEQSQMLVKLRHAKINKSIGHLKRKFKVGKDEPVKAGTFITKLNAQKEAAKNVTRVEKVSIMGAV